MTRSVFLPAAGIRLHAKVWEHPLPPLPPLLVLHGIFESWRSFAPLAAGLAAERAVYCLDLRGHGDSDRPSSGYRFSDYAEDVLAVLDRFDGAEVDLLGHSLGANVALFAASAGHPSLGRIVAVDPPVLLTEDWPAVRDMMRRERRHARLPVDEIVAELGKTLDRPVEWLEMIANDLANTCDGVFAAMADAVQGEVDWPAVLGRISVPTLAVAADPAAQGAQLTGHRLAEFRRGVPHAEVRVVAGAAHHVEVDRPRELRHLVETFLRAARPATAATWPADVVRGPRRSFENGVPACDQPSGW
jgi:pimeloyl-ACP methyl ester carboxylesterase